MSTPRKAVEEVIPIKGLIDLVGDYYRAPSPWVNCMYELETKTRVLRMVYNNRKIMNNRIAQANRYGYKLVPHKFNTIADPYTGKLLANPDLGVWDFKLKPLN